MDKHLKTIIKYANGNNYALRTEAYCSLISFIEKDKSVLEHIGAKHELSLLDINIIADTILKRNNLEIDTDYLFSYGNKRRIMLGLLMVKYGKLKCKKRKYTVFIQQIHLYLQ